MVELPLVTHAREEMLDITGQVARAVAASGVQEGFLVVQSPHTTLGLTVNENADPAVVRDMLSHLRRLVPQDAAFQHQEQNSDSHIKVSLIGPSVTLIIHQGHLMLGTWQEIFACEFDGPRQRQLWIQIVGQ